MREPTSLVFVFIKKWSSVFSNKEELFFEKMTLSKLKDALRAVKQKIQVYNCLVLEHLTIFLRNVNVALNELWL